MQKVCAAEAHKRERKLKALRFAQIKNFCFESTGFTDTFTAWSQENAHRIDLTMGSTEMHLDYTTMHQEVSCPMQAGCGQPRSLSWITQFVEVFEKRLEERVVEEGVTVEDFFLWLKEDLASDPASNNAFVVSGCVKAP